jgi:hypothetical protein
VPNEWGSSGGKQEFRIVGNTIRDLLNLRITRYHHLVLLPRIWQLRHDLSAYDTAYIAHAEKLGAALVTPDGRGAFPSQHAAAISCFDSKWRQRIRRSNNIRTSNTASITLTTCTSYTISFDSGTWSLWLPLAVLRDICPLLRRNPCSLQLPI